MMTQTGIFGSQLPTYLLHLGAIISVRKEADRLVIRLSGKTSQQQILFFSPVLLFLLQILLQRVN